MAPSFFAKTWAVGSVAQELAGVRVKDGGCSWGSVAEGWMESRWWKDAQRWDGVKDQRETLTFCGHAWSQGQRSDHPTRLL